MEWPSNRSVSILCSLANRLGAPEKKDDGYKFVSVEDMLLFLDIANRLKEVEVSEDFFLMSVLITPTPPCLLI